MWDIFVSAFYIGGHFTTWEISVVREFFMRACLTMGIFLCCDFSSEHFSVRLPLMVFSKFDAFTVHYLGERQVILLSPKSIKV